MIKSQAFEYFQLFEARLARETNHSIKILRTDNGGGGKFMSGEFLQYLSKEGIKPETRAPYTPQQNGVAERENRTAMASVRSFLHARNVPIHLWAKAVACAVYCHNRALSTVNTDVTPFEGWYKRKPTVSHLRIFWIPSVCAYS
jgi:transposase InsO family protein